MDAPIAMIRNGEMVGLHRNVRGLYVMATDGSGVEMNPGILWPALGWSIQAEWHLLSDDVRQVRSWYGSLVTGQTDRSGLQYRRNRYYNPESGQFTQPDPIGIAGGLNVYGYANGDPINFSDPFGLCPLDENGNDLDIQCRALVRSLYEVASLADGEGKNGRVFRNAARWLDRWDGGDNGAGRVLVGNSRRVTLNGRLGELWGCSRRADLCPGNFFIAGNQAAGDYIMTAVHEIGHAMTRNGGHGLNNRQLNNMCYNALNNLPGGYLAPRHATNGITCPQ